MHEGKLFAVIRPNGAIAPSMHGAKVLASSKAFMQNSVTVSEGADEFVRAGSRSSASS